MLERTHKGKMECVCKLPKQHTRRRHTHTKPLPSQKMSTGSYMKTVYTAVQFRWISLKPIKSPTKKKKRQLAKDKVGMKPADTHQSETSGKDSCYQGFLY